MPCYNFKAYYIIFLIILKCVTSDKCTGSTYADKTSRTCASCNPVFHLFYEIFIKYKFKNIQMKLTLLILQACLNCSGTDINCTLCNSTYYYISGNFTCSKICPEGTFKNNLTW